jgi:2-polyprenyl-3-methyl-5-hydroxy-6-metoxy-1,4-benzoquinol methylase
MIDGRGGSEAVISANVAFYKEIAAKYDQYESCAKEDFYQQMLEEDLDKMRLQLPARSIECLDCGGGSGNLTLKMLKRGWRVTVVDVSPEMLEISKAKVQAHGYVAEFVNDSVEHFLSSCLQNYDVVTFSSVLHHLYSPQEVVKEVASRIKPGGFFYSNFDPASPSSRLFATWFYNFDTILAKILMDRRDFLPGIVRRFRKLTNARDEAHGRVVVSAGDLAEYHARNGLDDKSLADTLRGLGFSVSVERYPVGRTKLALWCNRYLRALSSFKMLARRGSIPSLET